MKWSHLLLCCVIISSIFFQTSGRPTKNPKTNKHQNAVHLRHSAKGDDKQQKQRDLRQTTPEQPTETVPTSSGVGSDKDASTTPVPVECDEESREVRHFKSCRSLREVIFAHFNRKSQSQRLDTTYNAFTLVDIFYSGLLEGSLNNRKLPSVAHRMDRGHRVCDTLLNEWPKNVSSGHCSWHYMCTYNPNRFPSFSIEAVINSQRYLDAGLCWKEKMKYVTMFEKRPCEEDPCGYAENWVELKDQEIVVGFKAA